MCNKLYL